MRIEKTLLLAAAMLFPLAAFAAAAGRTPPLKKASFIPLWSPQAQFAGYFAAYEKGIYRKHGIDLKILKGGPTSPPGKWLETGQADFAVLWLSEAVKMRDHGVPLVNIAQVTQRSALVLLAKRSAKIYSPQDLNGKKISMWSEFSTQPKAFLAKYGIKAEVIPQSYTVNMFLRGGVDACSAMIYNEYHTILNSGVDPSELTVFMFDKNGLNFPEDGLYVLESTYKKDPALAREFALASMEGWQYVRDNKEEALKIVLSYMKEAKIPASPAHQRWMLDKMLELIEPPADGEKGALRKADYAVVASELKKAGLINKVPDWKSFSAAAVR